MIRLIMIVAALAGISVAAHQLLTRPTDAVVPDRRAARAAAPAPVRRAAPVAAAPLAGSPLARLHVSRLASTDDDQIRAVQMLGQDGRVIGTYREPSKRDPLYRVVELEVSGKRLGIEVDQSSASDQPIVTLTLDDGRQIVISRDTDPTGPLLPRDYTRHIELLDGLQRESNRSAVGSPPEVADTGSCTGKYLAADGMCFGDCADLACDRADLNLGARCDEAGGCCELVSDCSAFCLSTPGEAGDVTVWCHGRKAGRVGADPETELANGP